MCCGLPPAKPILVFNGRDGEWQAAIAGRKRPDSLTIVAPDPAAGPPARPRLCLCAAETCPARLHGAEGGRDGRSSLQPVLTRFTQVSRVNGERMRANVIEAAEQCGILSLAAVAEPVPLDRYLGQREAQRLLVFCDEAADVADPAAGAAAGDRRLPTGSTS